MSVISMQENYWNYDQDISNVGGVLGFGLATCNTCTTVLKDSNYFKKPFYIALGPESDYDWYYKANNSNPPEKTSSLVTWND